MPTNEQKELARLQELEERARLQELEERAMMQRPEAEKPMLQNVAEGVDAFFRKGSIAENVPIFGPLGRKAGEYFQAAVDYGVNLGDKPFDKSLSEIQARGQADDAAFVKENPGAATAQGLVGGIGGALLLPMPGAKMAGVSGAATRILGQGTMAAADTALRNPQDAVGAGLLTAGVQTALEAVPVVGRGISKATKELKIPEAAAWVGRKAARIMTGLDEEDMIRFAQRMKQINAAPQKESIKDVIDEAVGKKAMAVQAAKENLQKITTEAADAFKAAKYDLSRVAPSENLATEIMSTLDGQKAILGQLSEQADDILGSSNITVQKRDLLDFLKKIGKGIGVGPRKALVSDESVGAAKKLHEQMQRIDNGFGAEISSADLRGILREVRKDINWNRMAGEFNDTLNGARKEFTNGISKFLKAQIPQYDVLMAQMADISQNLDDMSKAFGTREKAVSSISQALDPKGKGALKLEALEKLSKLTGQDFAAKLDGARKARQLLEQAKRTDIRPVVIPEYMAKIRQAERALEITHDAFEPVKRLSPSRTQSIIERQGFKNASIEDRRALEALGKELKINLGDMIKDRATFDAFGKDYTRGARMAVAGGTVGAFLTGGSPFGAAVGSAAGATMDRYGGQIVKTLMERGAATPQLAAKYRDILMRAAQGGNVSLMATHQALLAKDREYSRLMGESILPEKKKATLLP